MRKCSTLFFILYLIYIYIHDIFIWNNRTLVVRRNSLESAASIDSDMESGHSSRPNSQLSVQGIAPAKKGRPPKNQPQATGDAHILILFIDFLFFKNYIQYVLIKDMCLHLASICKYTSNLSSLSVYLPLKIDYVVSDSNEIIYYTWFK